MVAISCISVFKFSPFGAEESPKSRIVEGQLTLKAYQKREDVLVTDDPIDIYDILQHHPIPFYQLEI